MIDPSEFAEFADVVDALRRYQPSGPAAERAEQLAAALAPPRRSRRWVPLSVAAAAIAGAAIWILLRPTPASIPARKPGAAVVDLSGIPADFVRSWQTQPREVLPGYVPTAPVTIVIFMDWDCPGCLVLEGDMRAVVAEFARTYPGRIVVIYEDWPWDAECNSTLPSSGAPMHPGSCELAEAVRHARDRGRDGVLIDWIRQHQTDWKTVGLPAEFQRHAGQKPDPAVQESIARGARLRINMTPTLFINGVRVQQIMSAKYLEWTIRLELARAGGQTKK